MTFELISDLHKDARGFRPTSDWLAVFHRMDTDSQQVVWDDLCAELDRTMAEEAAAQARAVTAFETRVAELIAAGAGDRATAIRWLADAEDVDLVDDPQGEGFLAYLFNLPYQYPLMKEAA